MRDPRVAVLPSTTEALPRLTLRCFVWVGDKIVAGEKFRGIQKRDRPERLSRGRLVSAGRLARAGWERTRHPHHAPICDQRTVRGVGGGSFPR